MSVKVYVLQLKGRPFVLRWFDPLTRTLKQRSTGTRDRKAAEEQAEKLSDELGQGVPTEDLTWKEFRKRFDTERLVSLSAGTNETYTATFNRFEKVIGPIRLRDVNASVLSRFQAAQRAKGLKEITIAKHTRQLRAALKWAYDLELIDRLPSVPKIGRGSIPKKMKGRPLTDAEFEKFLDAVDGVVGQPTGESWRFFAKGLWFQGLRVNEALHLAWDREDLHRVDLDQKFPVIWIRAELEKGKKDRIHPMAPEFADLLRRVPEARRSGLVFELPGLERTHPDWQRQRASKIGSAIGQAAGLLVAKDAITGREKFASFHDLRRSCALRWAAHLMPQELMEFMRHSSMQVTLDYYVGQRTMQTAATMWDAYQEGKRTCSL